MTWIIFAKAADVVHIFKSPEGRKGRAGIVQWVWRLTTDWTIG
jgi:hypothetical protein